MWASAPTDYLSGVQFLKKYEKCNAGLFFASLFWYDIDGKIDRLYRASAQDIEDLTSGLK